MRDRAAVEQLPGLLDLAGRADALADAVARAGGTQMVSDFVDASSGSELTSLLLVPEHTG